MKFQSYMLPSNSFSQGSIAIPGTLGMYFTFMVMAQFLKGIMSLSDKNNDVLLQVMVSANFFCRSGVIY